MRPAFFAFVAITAAATSGTAGSVRIYQNDFAGFVADAGTPHVIDFAFQPNGQPAVPIAITSTYNYTAQGATFSPALGAMFLAGNSITGFSLVAESAIVTHTYIIADLTSVVRAVGAFFPGDTTLRAYSVSGTLLGSVYYGGSGNSFFVGLVSDEPIGRATFDSNFEEEAINTFVFQPVPEPATVCLLLAATSILASRWRRAATGNRP